LVDGKGLGGSGATFGFAGELLRWQHEAGSWWQQLFTGAARQHESQFWWQRSTAQQLAGQHDSLWHLRLPNADAESADTSQTVNKTPNNNTICRMILTPRITGYWLRSFSTGTDLARNNHSHPHVCMPSVRFF
jgi:hypothetical protein